MSKNGKIEDIDWDQFCVMERLTNDAIDLKKAYIDMAGGDILAGLFISQVVFWELPSRDGNEKKVINMNGKYWIIKTAEEWHKETRLKEKQLLRCVEFWKEKKMIDVEVHHFMGKKSRYICLNRKKFVKLLVSSVNDIYEWSELPKGNLQVPKRELTNSQNGVSSIQRILTKTTNREKGVKKSSKDPDDLIPNYKANMGFFWREYKKQHDGKEPKITGVHGKAIRELSELGMTPDMMKHILKTVWEKKKWNIPFWLSNWNDLYSGWTKNSGPKRKFVSREDLEKQKIS